MAHLTSTSQESFPLEIPMADLGVWSRIIVPPMNIEEAAESILKDMGPLLILTKTVGQGGFGEIHYGFLLVGNVVQTVAVKVQKTSGNKIVFDNELNFYKEAKLWRKMTMPKFHYYVEDTAHRALAMDLLGPSLDSLHSSCNKSFGLKTVLMIADQLLCRLEELHAKGYIHKDLKPDNFVIGKELGKENLIYLIDYGHVEKFVDENGKHKKKEDTKHVCGTIRFMSPNAHIGKKLSRRDDMLSLFYVLMYFLHGSLPWHYDEYRNLDEKLLNVYHQKLDYTKGILHMSPPEFKMFYQELAKLRFADKPKYEVYKNLFRGLAEKKGFEYDFKYDWTGIKAPENDPNHLPNLA